MDEIFSELSIEITKENKKDIDRAIHKIVGVEYKNCPDAWKMVKEIIRGSEENEKKKFISYIEKELKKV
jgi:hypothetical protein